MCDEFDSKLINLVKANRILFMNELRSNPYAEERKKLELWRHIATSLGCETKYCILRWKYLQTKYQQEHQKLGGKQTGIMSFLQKPNRYQGKYGRFKNYERQKFPLAYVNVMDAMERVNEYVCDDDELQEIMDEQSISLPSCVKTSSSASVTTTTTTNDQHNATLRRIESLLEGLGEGNRQKAEKHIIAYLCKCQLKTLNNEEVNDDDVYI
uniref:MADF domain-containing protein n=1 Tax=Glossina brevipalpis TaxID=37001 RepID=A0A1A9WTG8_9MUSC